MRQRHFLSRNTSRHTLPECPFWAGDLRPCSDPELSEMLFPCGRPETENDLREGLNSFDFLHSQTSPTVHSISLEYFWECQTSRSRWLTIIMWHTSCRAKQEVVIPPVRPATSEVQNKSHKYSWYRILWSPDMVSPEMTVTVLFIPLAFRKEGKCTCWTFLPVFLSIELMCIVFTNAGHFSLVCLWTYQSFTCWQSAANTVCVKCVMIL